MSLPRQLRCSLFLSGIACLCFPAAGRAELVAYWNFNSYDGDAHVVAADISYLTTATLTIDSSWPSTDLAAANGTTLNAVGGDPAGSSLEFSSSDNNGTGFTMQFSMTGLRDPILTFAGRRTGSGFDENQLLYSLDGVNFTQIGANFDTVPGVNFQLFTFNLSSIDALDNASTVYLRIVLDGARNTSGRATFDNIQINAVPEPASLAMVGLGAFVIVLSATRRSMKDRGRITRNVC